MNKVSDIELYDLAVFEYVNKVSPRIIYSPTDRAMISIIKKYPEFKDRDPYPFASVYRDPNIQIDNERINNNLRMKYKLRVLSSTKDNIVNVRYLHSIPVTLTYQIDLWSVRATEVLLQSQSLLTKLTVTDPVLFVPINPDGELGRFHILEVNLVDNSDIESEDSLGRIYRHTFNFVIPAWIKDIDDVDSAKWTCPEIVVKEVRDIYD